MVRDDDTIAARVKGKFRIVHVLNTLEHNRTIPVLSQERYFLPCVSPAGEYLSNPRPRRPDNVLFYRGSRFLFELGAKDRISEADLVSNTANKRYIGIIQVTGSPRKGKRIQCDHQGGKPILFGTL